MTRSNTQRALMQPDEVLRLDNRQCIVLLRGQLPMMLYKITPLEFADYRKLRPVSIRDYPPRKPGGASGTDGGTEGDLTKAGDAPKPKAPDTEPTAAMPKTTQESQPPYSELLQPDDPEQEGDSPNDTTFIPTDDQLNEYQKELDKSNESEDAAL